MENNIFSKQWWSKTLNLHESPPNNFENDDNHQYVEDNLSSINKAAIVFNFPVEDMQLAFNGASSLVLMDDVWSNLENSNSYNIQSLGQALLYAKKHKIDPVPYLEAIKNMESLPKPLVLRYDTDKYYLVNGEFVLSLQKALNMTPDVLQATINVKIKEDGDQEDEINLVNEFIKYVKEDLGLVQTPKIEFSDDTDHVKEQSSFGYFSPDSNIVWVYTGDRNMADIFRTLAHELVHRKQDEDGKINYESGETGSDIENEANAKAGVLLRDFGKKHNDIYDTSIKKFIKNGLSEVKIEQPGINFTFPFWITKQNKSQAPFIADQLNKQGYTLNGRNGRKIEAEDITFNIPTILDYDSNYRDKPERKILNTYSPAYEVKIQQPINYKKAYGEVHSYNEMKKWENENSRLSSHFLVDRTNNTILAGFQEYNIPKWAWDLHNYGNDNVPPTENNKFALASRSSITNPPPYLIFPNIDVNNPASWSNIDKVRQYIKNLNEVKIQKPQNFNFNNFETVVGVSKVNTDYFTANYFMELMDLGSYYSFIPGAEPPVIFLIPKEYIDVPDDKQHLKQKITIEPELMKLAKNLVQDNKIEIVKQSTNLNEVKIQPFSYKFPKIPFNKFKEILIEDMKETAQELEFENPEEFINEFSDKLNQINNTPAFFEKIANIYEHMGWGDDEFLYILNRILIK